MRTPVFSGACTALVTPYRDRTAAINYDAFGKQIDNQIAAGVDAVCVCGTTGESANHEHPRTLCRRGTLRQTRRPPGKGHCRHGQQRHLRGSLSDRARAGRRSGRRCCW